MCVQEWGAYNLRPGFRRRPPTQFTNLSPDLCEGYPQASSLLHKRWKNLQSSPGLIHNSTSQSVNRILYIFHQSCHVTSAMSCKVSVCNPSTWELLRSPSAGDAWSHRDCQHLYLGFNPCSNTYKILRAWCNSDSPHHRREIDSGHPR